MSMTGVVRPLKNVRSGTRRRKFVSSKNVRRSPENCDTSNCKPRCSLDERVETHGPNDWHPPLRVYY